MEDHFSQCHITLRWHLMLTGLNLSREPLMLVVLCISILNLPREERYTVENVILVCVLPGPHKPK